MRSSKILVAIPSISRSNFPDVGWLPADFQASSKTMDCFKTELNGIQINKLWGINIPNFSLAEHGASGVAAFLPRGD
jgi:hypothetical protein